MNTLRFRIITGIPDKTEFGSYSPAKVSDIEIIEVDVPVVLNVNDWVKGDNWLTQITEVCWNISTSSYLYAGKDVWKIVK